MDRTIDTLYDDDFYAWTQQQATLLRQLPRVSNRLDAALIAEEIEDLGRSEVRSAQSLCEHIIEHLLKLEYAGSTEPVGHWRGEIIEWRLQLEKTLTRTITAKLDMPQRYRAARRMLLGGQDLGPELMSRIPPECPYSLDQIAGTDGEDWFPHPR